MRGAAPVRAAAVVAGACVAALCCLARAEEVSACQGVLRLESVDQVHRCAGEVLEAAAEDQAKAIRKSLGALQETRNACGATPEKSTGWGCKVLSDLSYELFATGLALARSCQQAPSQCEERGQAAAAAELDTYQSAVDRYQNTPAEGMVTRWLAAAHRDIFAALLGEETAGGGGDAGQLPPAWRVALRAADKMRHWVSGYIWRETQWHWLMDSLAAGKVVQTAWGEADEWLRFGVHDAYADAPLTPPPPKYVFSDQLGMRWDILIRQLRTLHERRGGRDRLLVVEIGVFAGHLSDFLLKGCDFIQLLGVDPYVGADDTFPGNFSRTLDADVALYKAASVMEPYGERAQLWPMTSEAAAAELPDGSVDAIFIDGCHFYDCVKQDFSVWMPKMRRNAEVLVAGHDFSPQWPGVVRAVHEERAGGKEVMLASDWMFWWFDRFE